jgi:hypothetical protein
MGLLHPLFSGSKLILTTRDFNLLHTIEAFYDTQSTVLIADDSLLNRIEPGPEDAFETLRMRTLFTNAEPKPHIRNLWEKFTKSYVFSAWVDPHQAGIIAINTPSYHDADSLGQLLPLNSAVHTENEAILTVSGPICPDFTYEKSPIAYRKKTSKQWQLPHTVYVSPIGFLYADAKTSST